jgi:hypothetical protein
MTELHDQYPEYDFATHKGYVTPGHQAALVRHGPCAEHRLSYANVVRARDCGDMRDNALLTDPVPSDADELEAAMGEWDEQGVELQVVPGYAVAQRRGPEQCA